MCNDEQGEYERQLYLCLSPKICKVPTMHSPSLCIKFNSTFIPQKPQKHPNFQGFFCINIEFQSTQCNGCWVPMLKGREQYFFILLQVQVGKRAIRIVGNSNLPSETGFFRVFFRSFWSILPKFRCASGNVFLIAQSIFSKHFGTSEYFSRF